MIYAHTCVLKYNDNLPHISSLSFVVLFSKTYRFSISILQPLHRELYTIDPTAFFVPTFLQAINDNTEESFRSIMSEPAPGIFTFEMLQPRFCELLLSEVFITLIIRV